MNSNTVEDLIEIISGMTEGKFVFSIQNTDRNLIFSLGKQCLRHIPFTDRQYELAKRKILDYKDQFEANGIEKIEEKFAAVLTYSRLEAEKKISGKLFRYDSNEAKDIHLALIRRVKKNSFVEI